MEIFVAAIVAALIGAGVAAALIHAHRSPAETGPDPVAEGIDALREAVETLREGMSSQGSSLSQRLEGIESRSASFSQRIFETLGEVSSKTSTVAEQAQQFTQLQDLLKPPKARGGVGEALLEELLSQVLPPRSYRMQHRFASGAIVDATVTLDGRIVCIDSKFPLSNYQRICEATTDMERAEAERAFAGDVAKHISAVSSRYIVPDEGTLDFAVMYVPVEGVYGEVLRLKHRQRYLWEIAIESRVVPMSPLSMYSYLQTICMGLRGLQVEKGAQKILDLCGRLHTDIERFASEYDTLGTHVSNAYNKYDQGARKLDNFRHSLDRVLEEAEEVTDGDGHEVGPSLEVVGE